MKKNICVPVGSFQTLTCPFTKNEFSDITFSPLKQTLIVLTALTIFMHFLPQLVEGILTDYKENMTSQVVMNMSMTDFFTIMTSTPLAVIYSQFKSAMFAGVNEELFCRFFLLRIVFHETLGLNINASILLSSICFGIIHIGNLVETGVFRHPFKTLGRRYGQLYFEQVIYTSLIGVVLGYVYVLTNNLILVMFLHFLFDFLAFMQTYVYRQYIKMTMNIP